MESRHDYLLRKGNEAGSRNMFLNLLRTKFGELPADALARVEAADVDTLSRWVGRVLTATTLGDVFAD